MDVEMIYRQQDGTHTVLGTRRLGHMPPPGEPFSVDDRQYRAKGFAGPDAEGRYRLFLEDDEGGTQEH